MVNRFSYLRPKKCGKQILLVKAKNNIVNRFTYLWPKIMW